MKMRTRPALKQPANVFFTEIQNLFGNHQNIPVGQQVTTAADQAQIATAVTDADCTQSTDLAGIYFRPGGGLTHRRLPGLPPARCLHQRLATTRTRQSRRTGMGKLVLSGPQNVSLDGVVQDPTAGEGFELGGWFVESGGVDREEWNKVALDDSLGAEAWLLGRRSYEYFGVRWRWTERSSSPPAIDSDRR